MSQNLRKTVIQMAKSGQHQEALELMRQHVKQNPTDVDAWWLLANMVKNLKVQRQCLNAVIKLNPNHQKARQKLTQVEKQLANVGQDAPAKSNMFEDLPDPDLDDFFDEEAFGAPSTETQTVQNLFAANEEDDDPFANNPFDTLAPSEPEPSQAAGDPFEDDPFADILMDSPALAELEPSQPASSPFAAPVVDDNPFADDPFAANPFDSPAPPQSAPAQPVQTRSRATDNPFMNTPIAASKPRTAPKPEVNAFELKFQKELKAKKQTRKSGGFSDRTAMIVAAVVVVVAAILIGAVVLIYLSQSDDLELNATASNESFSIQYADDWIETQHANDRIVITSRRMVTDNLDPWFFLSDGINGQFPALAFIDFVEQPLDSANGQELQAIIAQPVPQTPQYLIDIMIDQIGQFFESPDFSVAAGGLDVEIDSEKSSFDIDGQQAEFTVMDVKFSNATLLGGRDEEQVGLYFVVTQKERQHYLITMMVFSENPLDWKDNARKVAETFRIKA